MENGKKLLAALVMTLALAALAGGCQSHLEKGADAELQTESQANERELVEGDKPKETEETESTIIDEYSQVKNEFMEEGWLVCESWGNFDEDVPYVEEEIFEILKAAYAEIDFKGEFKKGDLDRYDEYKAVFQKLLQNEAPFLDNETGEETYIKDIPELHYDPSSEDHDENAYRYYFFDIDEDGLPEMGICNRKERANEIFFFKSDSQNGKISLWHQSGGWQIWLGSGKLGNSWGGGQYMAFTEFGSDREEKCKTNTFTIYDKENLRMVMAPIYADKQKEIEITDEMKSQGVYDLFWGQWYFRITDEQYHELTDGYWEAYKTAEERIKDVTYTYEELFGSLYLIGDPCKQEEYVDSHQQMDSGTNSLKISNVKLVKEVDMENIHIEYPYLNYAWDEPSRKINEQIYNQIIYYGGAEENLIDNDGIRTDANIAYHITYVDDNIISILFSGDIADGMSYNYVNVGLNFNLKSGEILSIADFYELAEIRDLIQKAVSEKLLTSENLPLDGEQKETYFNDFLREFDTDDYINRTDNFFIKDGSVCFIASPPPSFKEEIYIELKVEEMPAIADMVLESKGGNKFGTKK